MQDIFPRYHYYVPHCLYNIIRDGIQSVADYNSTRVGVVVVVVVVIVVVVADYTMG